uniref:Uncharacterized protein n=1 Tax=Leptocylindrus danicus TaxID=163516 RepID=A0A7S2PDX6_9STRA|mmetsp:Transcript_29385/g.43142  ORF Transcript_29385/g.43142 Transcript_29385/m.43142 type:complete len:127 (+) Transcript_29385:125-505(+)|eukprot:CAMPEP_0116031100 /NCGR_PEP_ID=MMETSP0321-20121206/17288_1 /TAXON_ID=163516 /ORGANISM="Leptocylindrus danicus var. danicus, Strain B650" /LENGTH=126 /DNA_ID=CAMNT_0003506111 /DNA_START=121 /DNA_END=501 /DNA_ORIENTATION=-
MVQLSLSGLVVVSIALCNVSGFQVPPPAAISGRSFALHSEKQQSNPLAGIVDFFSNFDDVIDDFMDKKMGNGEVFYGKRKYSPSGNFEGDYEGFGLSDFQKIEGAKERKEIVRDIREKRRQKESEQ